MSVVLVTIIFLLTVLHCPTITLCRTLTSSSLSGVYNILRVYNTSKPALSSPYGVALDQTNNIYIADLNNYRIVKLSANNSELAAFYSPSYSPLGLAVDDIGNIYFTNYYANTIIKLGSNGAVLATFDVRAFPLALALDRKGNMYYTSMSSANDRIDKISATGVRSQTYNCTGAFMIFSITVSPLTSNVYALDNTPSNYVICKFDNNGTRLPFDNAYVNAAVLIYSDAIENMYVVTQTSLLILSADGALLANNTLEGATTYGLPSGIAVNQLKQAYITSLYANQIILYSLLPPSPRVVAD